MDMTAILFNDAEQFEQIVNTHLKSSENCTSSFRDLKLHNFIHVYSLGARADNLQGIIFYVNSPGARADNLQGIFFLL